MKLKYELVRIPHSIPMRIFVGCQTVFNGKRNTLSSVEFNRQIRPYYDCEVVATHVNNGNIVMAIH